MGQQNSKDKFSSGYGASSSEGITFLLADWCGHCQQLKNSGEIKKLSSMVNVVVHDDKHKRTRELMKEFESNGFPTIIIRKGSKKLKHNGSRTADAIYNAYKNL